MSELGEKISSLESELVKGDKAKALTEALQLAAGAVQVGLRVGEVGLRRGARLPKGVGRRGVRSEPLVSFAAAPQKRRPCFAAENKCFPLPPGVSGNRKVTLR